jgi:hypothetical protein
LPRRVQALHCPARGSGLSFRDMRLLPILIIPLLVLPAPPATAQAFQIRDEDLYLDALVNMDGVQACEPRVGAAAIRSLRARLRLGEARARARGRGAWLEDGQRRHTALLSRIGPIRCPYPEAFLRSAQRSVNNFVVVSTYGADGANH